MVNKGLLITFSGTDCSGKSTQISLLRKKLRDEGHKCLIYWARGGYTRNFENLKTIIRFFFRGKKFKPGVNSFRTSVLKNRFISSIWLNLAILDLCILWIIILRIKLWKRNIVSCDRFIDDTKLDFKINFPTINFEKMLLWRILSFLRCRPEISFLLYVSPEESIKRSQLKNEPFPDDIKTLRLRLHNYLHGKEFIKENYFKIQTNKTLEEVSLIINKKLEDFI